MLTPGSMMTTPPDHAAIMVLSTASAAFVLSLSPLITLFPSTLFATTLTTPAPHVSTFYSRVASVNGLFVKTPFFIFVWMLPSFPPAPLHDRHHPASQPNSVRPLEEVLENYIPKNNHLYMLPHPFVFNSVAS